MTTINFQSPLEWPAGWERRKGMRRQSQFQVDLNTSISEMVGELINLGATLPILSSNLEFRRNGGLRVRQDIADPGVAVYFRLKGESQVMACDEFYEVRENIRAIGKTIGALRGIERWGGMTLQNRAFQGFKALPSGERQWWEVLGVLATASNEEIRGARNLLAKQYHPDGIEGDIDMMKTINQAYDLAMGR